MNIAITGATGHVGVNLIPRLIELGHNLKVLIYNGDGVPDSTKVEKVKGSLQDTASLSHLCKDADVVFHLASLISIGSDSYEQIYATNVEGTKNIFKAASIAGVKKFIHFSSIHALVHKPYDLPMDETRDIAINSPIYYEKTKAIAEQWVMEQNGNGVEVVVINPTSIIGPVDFGPSLMGEFMKMVYEGKIPALVSGGYDWVDVRDVVEATIVAIENSRGGERYILSGKWLSIKSFTDIFISFSDKNNYLRVLPLWLARLGVPFMSVFSMITGRQPVYTNGSLTILQEGNRFISSKKAQKELGFKPRPLEDTLFDTYNWFKENDYI